MPAFANLGFETAGASPGSAASWTLSTSAQAWLLAGYALSAYEQAFENFEREWASNEGYCFDLDDAGAVAAEYESATVNPLDHDGFEVKWSSNEGYLWALGATAAAEYDTALEDHEDFEEEWLSNESYFWTLADAGSAAAQYDTTPEAYEDFEEEWDANESYYWTLPATVAALYDTAPEAYEDYEEEWTLTLGAF